MKMLFVVQAYGGAVFGGAETHCRMMATRLVERGHEVSVVTSCAKHYELWQNEYEPGESTIDGVTVHRLPVDRPRDRELFGAMSGRVLTGHKPVPLYLQQHWIELQGPRLVGLPSWLVEHSGEYDVVIFFTYLYFQTVRGLPAVAGLVPTVLHPLSHDEAPFYLDVFDSIVPLANGIAYSVEEDQHLTASRFAVPPSQEPFMPASAPVQEIVGIGTELDRVASADLFRDEFDLQDAPYLVCVGRIDAHKGSQDLYGYFVEYKRRNPGPLKLVFAGEAVQQLPPHDDIIVTGWMEQELRDSAVAGALVSVHPSYFESFSMTLVEAWAQRRPALVNARCDVLRGQVQRSGGGIPYAGFAEFEVALGMLLEAPVLAASLGSAGRAYAESRYSWDHVLDNYETFIEKVIAHFNVTQVS